MKIVHLAAKHPWISCGIVLAIACVAFGPATTGHWIGSHGRAAVVGLFHFARGLFHGAF